MDRPHAHAYPLVARALAVGYGTTTVRAGLDFALPAGQLIGLVGGNGAGKSTLLRTLAGLQPALGGTVELAGRPLTDYPPPERARRLSVVLTGAPAAAVLTVRELVALGRHPYTDWAGRLGAADRRAVDRALAQTETTDLANYPLRTLSDGQRQRVLVARALAQDTPLLLLDEPTTHLDVRHTAYVLRLLKRLATEGGKTVLYSTHELDFSLQLCDQLLVLAAERTHLAPPDALVADGTLAGLFGSGVRFAGGRFLLE